MPDDLLRAIQAGLGNAFVVLGELGREGEGGVAYLAREVDTDRLVALKVEADGPGDSVSVTVKRALDASVPGTGYPCPYCQTAVHGWPRACPSCAQDISGRAPSESSSVADLRATARGAASNNLELLGDIPRSEGGGAVYFARDQDTGDLVALRLEETGAHGDESAVLLVTQTVQAVSPEPEASDAESVRAVHLRDPDKADPMSSTPPAAPGPSPLTGPSATSASSVYLCPSCGKVYEAGVWFCPSDGSALKPKVSGPDFVGRIVAARYRVIRKIGEGGMGQVYEAEHVRIGRRCALKIMNPALKNDPEALSRFGREASNASKINHPNVAAVHDFGETEDGLIYLAMEFAEGDSLTRLLEAEGTLDQDRAANIARQVADALSSAHEVGIIHRDLKPDNVIIAQRRGRDVAKVVDFGIAKAMEGEHSKLTRTGFVLGTPRYMSPEQLTGDPVDGRSDIYALGCILYEMLIGEPAFGGPTGESVITRRLTEPPPSPRERNRAVSRELDRIVLRAMARAPADRFESVSEMRAALSSEIQLRTAIGMRSAVGGDKRFSTFTARGSLLGRLFSGLKTVRGLVWAGVAVVALVGSAAVLLLRGPGGGTADPASPEIQPAPVEGPSEVAGEPIDSGSTGALMPESPGVPTDEALGRSDTPLLPGGRGQSVGDSTQQEALEAAAGSRPVVEVDTGAPPVRQADSPTVVVAEPPPQLAPATLDSLRAQLTEADQQAAVPDYNAAFRIFRAIQSRLAALQTQFPVSPALMEFTDEFAQARDAARTACEFLRNDDIRRGIRPAYVCS